MNKRGLSLVITTLILVVLVLVAIAIIWVVVNNILKGGTEGIALGTFVVKVDVKGVSINESANTISVLVKRNPGRGDVSGFKFIFKNETDTEIHTTNTSMTELESKVFTFTLSMNVSEILEISVIPLIKSEDKELFGMEEIYNVKGEGSDDGEGGTSCISHDYLGCYNGDVYWYDSCDNREELNETCRVEENCISGSCIINSSYPVIHLISPLDNTQSSQVMQEFRANITDDLSIKSLDIYLWDSNDNRLNLSEWRYTHREYYIGSQAPWPRDIYFDGTYWWIVEYPSEVHQYDDSWVYISSYFVGSQDNNPSGIHFDGTYWWMSGIQHDRVYQYDDNWNYTGVNYYLGDQDTQPINIYFDGTYWWMVGSLSSCGWIFQYDENWNYTGVKHYLRDQASWPRDIYFDGTYWWMAGQMDGIFKYYSNWTYTGTSYSTSAQDGSIEGMYVDGVHGWIIKSFSKKVYEYLDITLLSGIYNSTAWNYTFSVDGAYKWNVYGCDSDDNCCWAKEGNYTFIMEQ